MNVRTSPVMRRAGRAQGIALIAVAAMPTLALAGLVADLPQLFRVFADHPNHAFLVPMVITVPSLCVALFSGVAGTIADLWGRRPLLLLALLLFALTGLMPLAFDELPWIIASRVVVGLAEAAILTVGNALMGDYFENEERQKWIAYQNMLGPFIGSAVLLAGGFLAGWHWRAPFLLYLLGLVVLALAYWACWEPQRQVRPAGTAGDAAAAVGFPWRTTFMVCGVTLLVSIVYFVQAVQHGRIFNDLGVSSPEQISVLVTVASMGTVVGGYLFKRFGQLAIEHWLSWGLVAYGMAYVGVSLVPNASIGLPIDALGQVGGGIVLPALIAWALRQYAFEHRGRGMGLWGGSFFLGQFFSPPLVTLIGSGTGSFLSSVAAIGWMCLAAALLVQAVRRFTRDAPGMLAPASSTSTTAASKT